MSATLLSNTVVAHPETGMPTALLAGQAVPEWATNLVGDHLVEKSPETAGKRVTRKQATDTP